MSLDTLVREMDCRPRCAVLGCDAVAAGWGPFPECCPPCSGEAIALARWFRNLPRGDSNYDEIRPGVFRDRVAVIDLPRWEDDGGR